MWEEAKACIAESPEDSSVYIGCDSVANKRKKNARYSVVVVVHKSSHKGARVFHNSFILPDYGILKTRLLNEVGASMEAADIVLDVLGHRHLEIHLDINSDPKHKSHVALKEAIGWVQGMGYDVKAKPDSWAAYAVGDHVVRGKSSRWTGGRGDDCR
jgi:predicted RNase H-related nuclease YkuK (DUF458 family)